MSFKTWNVSSGDRSIKLNIPHRGLLKIRESLSKSFEQHSTITSYYERVIALSTLPIYQR